MKVLGCLVYYRNTNTKGDKFKPRGKLGVFMCYPYGTKGYKVYDIGQRKIITSRDVRFVEEVFPFSNIEQKETSKTMIFSRTWLKLE